MACVDRFALGKPWIGRSKSNGWIKNKIKNAINNCDELFQIWIRNPTEPRCNLYKRSRQRVKEMIRSEKQMQTTKNLVQWSNIFEKILHKRMMNFCQTNKQTSDPDAVWFYKQKLIS